MAEEPALCRGASVPLPERFDPFGLAPSALNSMSSPEFPRPPVCVDSEGVIGRYSFVSAVKA